LERRVAGVGALRETPVRYQLNPFTRFRNDEAVAVNFENDQNPGLRIYSSNRDS
jgi:hypothetical protein